MSKGFCSVLISEVVPIALWLIPLPRIITSMFHSLEASRFFHPAKLSLKMQMAPAGGRTIPHQVKPLLRRDCPMGAVLQPRH